MYSLFSCYLRGMLWVFKLFLQYHNIIFLIRKPTNMAKRLLVSGDSLVHSHPQLFFAWSLAVHAVQNGHSEIPTHHIKSKLRSQLPSFCCLPITHILHVRDVEWLTASQCLPGNWLSFGYAYDQHTKHIKPVQKHETVNMQSSHDALLQL